MRSSCDSRRPRIAEVVLIDLKGDPSILDQSEAARKAQELGFDGFSVGETKHDAFVSLSTAAVATSTIRLTTGVAIAFARTPMTVAYAARDLQELARGKAEIGLGTQVEAHVARRFGMPWSRPVARMQEFLEAVRAIWMAWDSGEPLKFDGDFYHHSLMTPNFAPDFADLKRPPLLVAAVGPRMTAMASEHADGIMLHSLQSPKTLAALTVPAIGSAMQRRSSGLGPLQVHAMPFVVTGADSTAMRRASRAVKSRIGFYSSTPAYREVLAVHGWETLADEATKLVRERKWEELHAPVDDTMLAEFAVVAEPGRLRQALAARYDRVADVLTMNTPYEIDPSVLADAVSN